MCIWYGCELGGLKNQCSGTGQDARRDRRDACSTRLLNPDG
ncbi:MAG: hypothetical protein JWM59_2974 [Verrucomicrobiales bacterium]|nr:hypothetical protein [Verrucomicrobiales bacterium]